MHLRSETVPQQHPRSEPDSTPAEVRVAVPGFAALYAAALELPLERLQSDPSWCVAKLAAAPLVVDVL